ncbi:MAG: response regulator [Nitrospirae bacterium]|nr:MAG: response regulator [Nitrospirota bacterium]
MKTDTVRDQVQVLLVDDEENILKSLRRLLMGEDMEVLTANSGQEGLDILKKTDGNIGVIVSDQRMPGMSGVEFLEQARAINPDAVRIVLTGYADVNAAVDAINRGGAYRYITKPWQDEELVQVIRDAINQYSLVRENRRLNEVIKRQNEELKKWNAQLEVYVQEQTVEIQKKNEKLEFLNKRLRNNFKNTILAFSGLLEMRDAAAQSHSRNVAELSVRIARALDLEKTAVEEVMVAALLHDIGKIGIPDVLLRKEPSAMNDEELALYRQHPVRGQAAVDSIEDLRGAGILVRHHHEAFDGSGFPDGKKGKEIPVGARIIAVADFIDRELPKYEVDNAVELTLREVEKKLGSLFDPGLKELLPEPVKVLYSRNLPKKDLVEVELSPVDLRPGMVVARDVRSGTGLMLLRKGTTLDEKNIRALRRYAEIDPAKSGVFVYIKR